MLVFGNGFFCFLSELKFQEGPIFPPALYHFQGGSWALSEGPGPLLPTRRDHSLTQDCKKHWSRGNLGPRVGDSEGAQAPCRVPPPGMLQKRAKREQKSVGKGPLSLGHRERLASCGHVLALHLGAENASNLIGYCHQIINC